MNTPLVSICLITYNHEKYIAQAIEGVLMQETEYNWELVIADDFSTDNTRAILLSYKEKYPDKIKLILQEKNVGANKNWIDLLSYPLSKYIAYFEGDDYWIDKQKLQKQVAFLEAHVDYGLVHTNYKKLHEHTQQFEQVNINIPQTDNIYNHLLTQINFIGTLTVCFKNSLFKNYLLNIDPINKTWKLGDLPLWIYIAKNHKVKYLNNISAVYRIQEESASSSKNTLKLIDFEHSVRDIKLYFAGNSSKKIINAINAESTYKLLKINLNNSNCSKLNYSKLFLSFISINYNIKRFTKALFWLVNKLSKI